MKLSTAIPILTLNLMCISSTHTFESVRQKVLSWRYGDKNAAMMRKLINDVLHKQYKDDSALIKGITAHQESIPIDEQLSTLYAALNGTLKESFANSDLLKKNTHVHNSFALMQLYTLYDHFFNLDRSMCITQSRIQKNYLKKVKDASSALTMIEQLRLYTQANQPLSSDKRTIENAYLLVLEEGLMKALSASTHDLAWSNTFGDVKISWRADMPKEELREVLIEAFDTYVHYFNATFPKTQISSQLKRSFETKIKQQMR